jgi:hypothetical protein
VPIDSSEIIAGGDGTLTLQYVTYLGTTVLDGIMDAAQQCLSGGQSGSQYLFRGNYSFTSSQQTVSSDYGTFEMTLINHVF